MNFLYNFLKLKMVRFSLVKIPQTKSRKDIIDFLYHLCLYHNLSLHSFFLSIAICDKIVSLTNKITNYSTNLHYSFELVSTALTIVSVLYDESLYNLSNAFSDTENGCVYYYQWLILSYLDYTIPSNNFIINLTKIYPLVVNKDISSNFWLTCKTICYLENYHTYNPASIYLAIKLLSKRKKLLSQHLEKITKLQKISNLLQDYYAIKPNDFYRQYILSKQDQN
jgi:hypothetical protein